MDANDSVPGPPASPEILESDLSFVIVGAFYEVYNELGFGFLEAIYVRSLEIALRRRGLHVEREHEVMVFFRGEQVGRQRLDLLVERRIVSEVKSVDRIVEAHRRQLRNYLAAMNLRLGLLLHFGPTPQVHRIIGPRRPESPRSDSP